MPTLADAMKIAQADVARMSRNFDEFGPCLVFVVSDGHTSYAHQFPLESEIMDDAPDVIGADALSAFVQSLVEMGYIVGPRKGCRYREVIA